MSPKKATTIEEQIAKLKDRGMDIDDYDKAFKFLSHVNYYRIGSYTFPFEQTYPEKTKRTHFVRKGTKFSDIINLYYFDKDLRNFILKYISIIEVSFKTKVINIVSIKYEDDNAWYLNPKILSNDYIDRFQTTVLENTSFRRKKTIQNFKKNHGNRTPPYAWITIEHMTLGSVVEMYKNLLDSNLKLSIAKEYEVIDVVLFERYLDAIVCYRNECAHESAIYDLTIKDGFYKGPKRLVLPEDTNKIFAFIAVIKYFLSFIDDKRYTEFNKEVNVLINSFNYNKVLKPIIEKCTGFQDCILKNNTKNIWSIIFISYICGVRDLWKSLVRSWRL